uniref:unspecific monooxygenase n=1 Tax=Cyclopterus lumpus TaxID=8103 RepID=A0A8C2WBG9_CYCLU
RKQIYGFPNMLNQLKYLSLVLKYLTENLSIFGPYSIDVMASCAFSLDVDSINNPSSPIIDHASKLFRFPVPVLILQGASLLFPFLYVDVKQLRLNPGDVLQNMINSQTANKASKGKQKKGNDSYSHKPNHKRTLVHSHQSSLCISPVPTGLTDHEILSQAIMFMFAGYETSTTTLVFLAYNLATNPEVMKRLQEEIDSTFPDKGAVRYEALMQMEYLDCVVNESLRLYPPAARLDRIAKETVKICGITIQKDMVVMIPVYALQRDPELWPEPEEFRPDRFSKQNKQSIKPYAYMPFGVGPRNCLGMRFAQVMVKLALVDILQNYSFSVCEETEIPLEMDYKGFVGPLNPIKLKLETR